jgi:DNA adenine methylase
MDKIAPILNYPGAKSLLASWIISFFPLHTQFVDLFGGGASIILNKIPSKFDIYNDLDHNVYNFFRVLRDRGAEFKELVKNTIYSREDHANALSSESSDPLEMARCFYIVNSFSFSFFESKGFSFIADSKRLSRFLNNDVSIDIISRRLRNCIIENLDYKEIIRKYDSSDTLFYVDPPYYQLNYYKQGFTEQDHIDLAELLHKIKGNSIVSGYRSDLYDSLYSDFVRHEKDCYTIARDIKTEYIWLKIKNSNSFL